MKFFKPNRPAALLPGLFILQAGGAAEDFSNPVIPGFYPDPSLCDGGFFEIRTQVF